MIDDYGLKHDEGEWDEEYSDAHRSCVVVVVVVAEESVQLNSFFHRRKKTNPRRLNRNRRSQ